ncbi:hypothetical protein ABZO31_14760 [Streptomyces sp. HUAS MG47]|uniref:hypothetical protein n=1 Tax=Streptomyces solicamelliae TaxID=3231716 RepID=UPI0038779A26
MTAATFTPVPSVPRSHRLGLALRAVLAYGGAAVEVVLFGVYDVRAGVREPRPEYVGTRD